MALQEAQKHFDAWDAAAASAALSAAFEATNRLIDRGDGGGRGHGHGHGRGGEDDGEELALSSGRDEGTGTLGQGTSGEDTRGRALGEEAGIGFHGKPLAHQARTAAIGLLLVAFAARQSGMRIARVQSHAPLRTALNDLRSCLSERSQRRCMHFQPSARGSLSCLELLLWPKGAAPAAMGASGVEMGLRTGPGTVTSNTTQPCLWVGIRAVGGGPGRKVWVLEDGFGQTRVEQSRLTQQRRVLLCSRRGSEHGAAAGGCGADEGWQMGPVTTPTKHNMEEVKRNAGGGAAARKDDQRRTKSGWSSSCWRVSEPAESIIMWY